MHKNISEKPVLVGCSRSDLETLIETWGEKPFRARQLEKWLFEKAARSFEAMSDLSKSFRQTLQEKALISTHEVVQTTTSRNGTTKFLIRMSDGQSVECVTIVQERRLTACLSSQVGCNVGCPFCATGLSGFRRNLSVAEIVDQFLLMQAAVQQGALKAFSDQDRISNIVFMGMGEPLLNYEALIKSIEILNRQAGVGIRKITISTSGIIPKIERLMHEPRPYNLAVSLHAVKPEIRDQLVPINKKYTVDALLDVVRRYAETTGRRITFEYTMLQGYNASLEDAEALAKALKGIHCHINLIAYNPVDSAFQAPPREEILKFQQVLHQAGFPITIRQNHGQDDMAACGQLRLYADEQVLQSVGP